jgi:hypothetical protein
MRREWRQIVREPHGGNRRRQFDIPTCGTIHNDLTFRSFAANSAASTAIGHFSVLDGLAWLAVLDCGAANGGVGMPERFESRAYSPEMTMLMKEAFSEARHKIGIIENDAELTQKLLASAILDQINAGVLDREKIVAAVVATLAVAKNVARH